MTPTHARYAVFAFLLLSMCVAGNIMFLQDNRGGNRVEASRSQIRFSAERAKRYVAEQPANAFDNAAPVLAAPPTKLTPVNPATGQRLPQLRANFMNDITAPTAAIDSPEVVSAIQRELQARNYEPGVPDGVAGAVTRGAVMAWEFDNGLIPTGEPTEALMRAIILGASPALVDQVDAQFQALPKEKKARPEVLIKSVQSALSALGYNAGKVTGRINEETARSIREFEVDQNLSQSGRISGPLVARLMRLTAMGRLPAPR